MSSKQIAPGDLVYLIDRYEDAGYSMAPALVVAVEHACDGSHQGCEDRISVLLSQLCRIKLVCDCSLIKLDDMS